MPRVPQTTTMKEVGNVTGKTAAVCVTVPHTALTAPRRVASLKSLLAPHLPDRGRRRLAVAAGYSGNWHSERAFGKFPPIYRSVHQPNPHGVRTRPSRGDESGILRTNRAGRDLERVERHPGRFQKKISGLPRSTSVKTHRRQPLANCTRRRAVGKFTLFLGRCSFVSPCAQIFRVGKAETVSSGVQ